VLLEAYVGRRYPDNTSEQERLATWLEATREIPDDPDVWYNLGDIYFHMGAIVGVEEPLGRAAEAFKRALALDTTLNVEPMIHLLQIAGLERDTATVRRLIARLHPDHPSTALQRLEAGAILGDSAMIAAARPRVDSTGLAWQLLLDALLFGFAMGEAERNAARYLESSRPGPDQLEPVFFIYNFYQQLGRPAAAAAALAHLGPEQSLPRPALGFILVHAFYGDVDPSAAAGPLARAAPLADGPLARDSAARSVQASVICAVEMWRLAHAKTRTTRAAIARLVSSRDPRGCNALLEALLAAAEHRPEAAAAFDHLDTLVLTGRARPFMAAEVARWREAHGDLQGALRAIRRCAGYSVVLNLAYCRREEGRLAALVGDRAGAINAYSQYLAMRYNPEPSIKPEVDRVRAELTQLVSEPSETGSPRLDS